MRRTFSSWCLVLLPFAMIANAADFFIPNFEVTPGSSGTFDIFADIGSLQPVWGYDVRVTVDSPDAGFRIPSSVTDLFGGRTISREHENAISASNAVFCFPEDPTCPPGFFGEHMLLRADYHVNPNVVPGTTFELTFDESATGILGIPSVQFVGGTVNVVDGGPVVGGPIGPNDLSGRAVVEPFEFGLADGTLLESPIEVRNAVISARINQLRTENNSDYVFGEGIATRAANETIIVDFTVDARRVGAWVGFAPVEASFYSGDTLLGTHMVHDIQNAPVFLGFESLAGPITRAEYTGLSSGRVVLFDNLVTDLIDDSLACDFDRDSVCDVDDLNAMLAEGPLSEGVAVQPGSNGQYDLNGDGVLDMNDVTQWLGMAAADKGLGGPYLMGDANLDGVVDVSDFNRWNTRKFTTSLDWDHGNFNGDEYIDVSDFAIWNASKFTFSADVVPEPATLWTAVLAVGFLASRSRQILTGPGAFVENRK